MATKEARQRARAKYLETHRLYYKCENCGIDCDKPYRSRPYHFCSKSCSLIKTQTGKRDTEANRWLGDKVGYGGVHTWIKSVLVKTKYCSVCQVEHHRTHWANISESYLRHTDDWAELCPSCHKLYDSRKLDLMWGMH